MNIPSIEKILQDLAVKPIGIQGVALVSQEAQSLIVSIGIDEPSTSIVSGMMLYLAKTVENEFDWREIEMISIRSEESHIILAYCSPEVYLLIKVGKVLTGLIEGEVGRTVKKIQTALKASESSSLQLKAPESSPLQLKASESSPLQYRVRAFAPNNKLTEVELKSKIDLVSDCLNKVFGPISEVIYRDAISDLPSISTNKDLANLINLICHEIDNEEIKYQQQFVNLIDKYLADLLKIEYGWESSTNSRKSH